MTSLSEEVSPPVSAYAMPAKMRRMTPMTPSQPLERRTILSPAQRLDRALGEEEREDDDREEVGQIAGIDDAFDQLAVVLGERKILQHRAHGFAGGLRRP